MHLREIKRIDITTLGLGQNVLFEKYWFLLHSSNLRFGSFQLTFAVSDIKAANPLARNLHKSVARPTSMGSPTSIGGTWTIFFNSRVFILMCIKICMTSTSNPCFNGYNKISYINTGLACLLFLSSRPSLTLQICSELTPFRYLAQQFHLALLNALCPTSLLLSSPLLSLPPSSSFSLLLSTGVN